jgi:hypothetical protein
MDRVASKPLNDEAVDRASDEFYARHPELIENGKRIPLDPCDPAQEALRREWMDLYIENGGGYYYGKFSPGCDDPVLPCSDKGVLMVQVVDEEGNPLGDALVELLGHSSGWTFDNGWYDFGELPAPQAYNLRVVREGYDPNPAWASRAVAPCEVNVVLVVLRRVEVPGEPDDEDDVRGAASRTCKLAQEKDPKIKELVERVNALIDFADWIAEDARAALQHYMNGSGSFVEIPAEYAREVERGSVLDPGCWPDHRDNLVGRMQDDSGTKGRLALRVVEEVVPPGDPESIRVKPESEWPWEVTLTYDFASGRDVDSFWEISDSLTYFGSALRSVVKVRCRRYDPDLPRNYLCSVESWRTWVVDNYDWEGAKGGFGIGDLRLPTQEEMNSLREVGCARAYQRSSRSWEVEYWSKGTPNYVGSWIVEFGDDDDVRHWAAGRWGKEHVDTKLHEHGLRRGALPNPGPAEEM